MKTSEIIALIISSIGGSAALFAVVACLARSLIKHFFERDLVSFKLNLEKVAFEHQIRFSKLHEIRAQVIADLYSRLFDFHWAVCAFLRDFHKADYDAQRVQYVDDRSYEFKDFFDKHRIYFTENICSKIDDLVNALYSAYVPLEGIAPDTDRNDKRLRQDWIKCAKIVQEKYPAIRESLESDFRKILGVTKIGE
jgi:hypothetical protein